MNPFMAAGAVLCLGAGLWACKQGDPLMAIIYFAWAVADVAAGLKG